MLPKVKKEVTALLATHYPDGEEAALLTEGLMELGERVCIPNGTPRCDDCPVKALCLAHEKGIAAELPVRNVKGEKRRCEKTVLLLRSREGRYAIRKREKSGLLADMWELVNFDGFGADGDVESYLAEHGIRVERIEPLPDGKHIFTHVIWQMKGFMVNTLNENEEFLWKTRAEILAAYAIPTAFKTYVKLMKE